MHALVRLGVLLLFTACATHPGGAQPASWNATGGPDGGHVSVLLAYDAPGEAQGVLAGTYDGGVFQSEDGGRVWQRLGRDFPDAPVLALHRTTDGTVYAGTLRRGVVRLAPGAMAWADLSSGLGTTWSVHAFTSRPDGTVFAAGFGGGLGDVHRLAPGAASWTATGADASLSYRALSQTADGRLLVGADEGRVFRSDDDGATWTEVGSLPGVADPYAFLRADDGTLYAPTFGSGVVRSTDDGDTWTTVNDGQPDDAVWSLALADDGTLYAGTRSQGVYRSTDGGASWSAVNLDLPPASSETLEDVTALAVTSAGEVLAGLPRRAGVYRLDDTERWTESNTGLAATRVHALALSQGLLVAGTDGAGVFAEVDLFTGGWTRRAATLAGDLPSAVTALTANVESGEDPLYAGTDGDGVFRSIDGGATWTPLGLPGVALHDLLLQSDGDLFAATDDGLYRLREGAADWAAISDGLVPPSVEVEALAEAPGAVLYAGAQSGTLYRSDDDGTAWTALTEPFARVTDLLVDRAGRLFVASDDGALHRSDDGGATWTDVTPPSELTPFTVTALAHGASTGTLFAAVSPLDGIGPTTVFRSIDAGATWAATAEGLPPVRINDLFALEIVALKGGTGVEPYVFAATDGAGVWRLEGDAGSSTEPDEQPALAALWAAYPNPFATQTTLRYTLERPVSVRLAVYDVLGREVAVLVDAVQAPGSHTAVLEAEGLPAGVYVARLEAGAFRTTRTLLHAR